MRKEDYKEFQEFTETPCEVILKHVSTRWLSLEKCMGRMLSQWPALQSYFNSIPEAEKGGRPQRCMDGYNSVELKLTYHFLVYALKRLNKFNILFQVTILHTKNMVESSPIHFCSDVFFVLQSEGCKILHVLDEANDLLESYLACFVDKELLQANKSSLLNVQYKKRENQLSDLDLDLGSAARTYLTQIEEDVPEDVIANFYL